MIALILNTFLLENALIWCEKIIHVADPCGAFMSKIHRKMNLLLTNESIAHFVRRNEQLNQCSNEI